MVPFVEMPALTSACGCPVYTTSRGVGAVTVAAAGVMEAVVVWLKLTVYLSSVGFTPVMVTVLFVPTPALSNLPVKVRGMVSFPNRSPSFHVMTRSALSLALNTLSFAVTTAVTGFFSALNDQVSETSP